MKIVVLDGYTENPGDLSWDALKEFGELVVYDRTPVDNDEEIISRIGDAEVVYTNKTPINKHVIDTCKNMKMISLLATGYQCADLWNSIRRTVCNGAFAGNLSPHRTP